MKQPDTAALRERLANYTPEEELKQDMQELDGLLQEVNCQIVGLRNLLNEIQALKEELHGIHGSLKHTVQRERAAFKALEAAKESADNIVDAKHIEAEKELLEEHRNKLAKHLHNCEGIWLSNRWFIFMIVVFLFCYIVVFLWAFLKD